MVAFGGSPTRENGNSASHSQGKKVPPPLASSTPKKRTNSTNGVFVSTSKLPIVNGINGNESPPKKRRVLYMDEDEDYSGTIAVYQPAATATGHGKTQKKLQELQEQRKQLPIAKGRDALIREIRENDIVVLVGETGSGKTTQIPQYILDAGISGNGQIGITQPRRVAATSLASRVAEEQGVSLGTRVGYVVRFNEQQGPETKIKYMTDGMLCRELLVDPLLSRYSVIIIDEAHERTLNTDVLLASLKTIQRRRRDEHNALKSSTASLKGKERARNDHQPLKIVVMSATLDAEKFSRFFNGAKVLYVKGRQHPVQIYYSMNSQPDYADAAVRTFFQVHTDYEEGDVLIFLPGQEDIETVQKAINSYAIQLPLGYMGVLTCPMYANLPQSMQARVFKPAPSGLRKCILATNIAETSITIPGVRYVIDTGKHNEKRHFEYAGGGLDSLMTQNISKSSAMQRAGRAGREGPGICFRLYTESSFRKMEDTYLPEILRTNLVQSTLQVKCIGQDIQSLEFMDRPDADAVKAAYTTLCFLGALDGREVTKTGRLMNKFPLEPALARALVASQDNGCTLELISIVSVLSASAKLFFDTEAQRDEAQEARRSFRDDSGDHITALKAFRAYEELVDGKVPKSERTRWCQEHFVNERAVREAYDIQKQLRGICERENIDWTASCGKIVEPVLKSLLFGLAQNTAMYQSEVNGYRSIIPGSSMKIRIHPGSVLSDRKRTPGMIMFDQPLFTKEIYARGVSIVPPEMYSVIPALLRVRGGQDKS